jgi:hypothetical protein
MGSCPHVLSKAWVCWKEHRVFEVVIELKC